MKPVQMTLDHGVLCFEDGTEVLDVSVDLLKAAPDLLHACGLLKKAWERAARDQQVDWDSLNLATEKAIEAYNKATGAIVEKDE